MQLEVGGIYEGKVTGITKFGAFVSLDDGQTGMVHISEIAPVFVENINDFLKVGQVVKVKVLLLGDDGKISLSIRKALPEGEQRRPRRTEPGKKDEARKPQRTEKKTPRQPQPGPGRPGDFEWQSRRNDSGSFEDMMTRFKQTSDEKMSDLKKSGIDVKKGSNRRGQPK